MLLKKKKVFLVFFQCENGELCWTVPQVLCCSVMLCKMHPQCCRDHMSNLNCCCYSDCRGFVTVSSLWQLQASVTKQVMLTRELVLLPVPISTLFWFLPQIIIALVHLVMTRRSQPLFCIPAGKKCKLLEVPKERFDLCHFLTQLFSVLANSSVWAHCLKLSGGWTCE